MSSQTQDYTKPRLDRKTLEKNGILFADAVYNNHDLPNWLQPTYGFLTQRRTKLPFHMKDDLKCDIIKPDYEVWDLQPDDDDFEPETSQRKTYITSGTATNSEVLQELDICAEIQGEVMDLYEKNTHEPDWQALLRQHIFTPYRNIGKGCDRLNNILMRCELLQGLPWTEFAQSSDNGVRNERVHLTCPKPDFAYGFPIFNTRDDIPAEYYDHRLIDNFSLRELHELRKKKVLTSPRTAIGQWNRSKPVREQFKAADLMCLPWAVVEVKSAVVGSDKKDFNKKEFCYCQAANASAAALVLRERLRLASGKNDPNPEALVIVAFTCIGLDVKLWFTYRLSESKIYMDCVWATSLDLLWGVFALRMIVQNMHEWANRDVKPELARWIEGVRGHKPEKVFLGPTINRSTRAASHEPQSEGQLFQQKHNDDDKNNDNNDNNGGNKNCSSPTKNDNRTLSDKFGSISLSNDNEVQGKRRDTESSLFGQGGSPSQARGLFCQGGSSSQGSAFGQGSSSSNGGLFGSSSQGSAFGQGSSSSKGGLFGSSSQGSAFGQGSSSSNGGLFGSSSQGSAFGQGSSSSEGGLFGQDSSSSKGALFGSFA